MGTINFGLDNWGIPVNEKLGLDPMLGTKHVIAQPSQNAPMEAISFLRGIVKLAARQARFFTEAQIGEIDTNVVNLANLLILSEEYISFQWDSAPAGCSFEIEAVNYRASGGGYLIEILLAYPEKIRRLVIEDGLAL